VCQLKWEPNRWLYAVSNRVSLLDQVHSAITVTKSALFVAYRIMHYILRNVSVRPHQVSHCVRTFDALLRNNLYRFWVGLRCASYPTFLFDRFKCLMLFTNLHFFSIIQRSCMMENKCSSSWWIVLVFASHQYCFCAVKRCGGNVYTRSIQVRNAAKAFCSSQCWSRANIDSATRYSMTNHFLYSCEWQYSLVMVMVMVYCFIWLSQQAEAP